MHLLYIHHQLHIFVINLIGLRCEGRGWKGRSAHLCELLYIDLPLHWAIVIFNAAVTSCIYCIPWGIDFVISTSLWRWHMMHFVMYSFQWLAADTLWQLSDAFILCLFKILILHRCPYFLLHSFSCSRAEEVFQAWYKYDIIATSERW